MANVINRCSPGWCVTIGFPFTWQSWSEAIVTFGNGHFTTSLAAIGQVVGAVLNLFTFAAVAGVLTRAQIRSRSA